jgi:hypothetical protein
MFPPRVLGYARRSEGRWSDTGVLRTLRDPEDQHNRAPRDASEVTHHRDPVDHDVQYVDRDCGIERLVREGQRVGVADD